MLIFTSWKNLKIIKKKNYCQQHICKTLAVIKTLTARKNYDKKLLAILTIGIFLNSCGCIKMELTKEERNWYSYEEDEYLIFKSNLKNIDTLNVTDRYESYTNEDCNNISVSYYQLNYINLTLMLKSKTKSVLISWAGDCWHHSFQRSEYPENGHKATKQKIKLKENKKTYNNAYLFKDKVTATNIEDGYLDSFYYDQNDGLVKYVAKDGESFELIKRIKN